MSVWRCLPAATVLVAAVPAVAEAQCVPVEKKLTALDGAAGDYFGLPVSISGDVAVVGAFRDDDNGPDSGSAYIFRQNGAAWVQEAKLTASDGAAGDEFGYTASICGDVAVVKGAGSAYFFRHVGGAWVEEWKFTAPGGVSISGDVTVVGRFIFRHDGGAWVEEAELTTSDGVSIGFRVSICGDVVVFGKASDDEHGPDSGSAYIFRHNGGAWVEEAKITASDGGEYLYFGRSVSISGEVVMVGSYNEAAYVFHHDGAAWVEEAKITASDGEEGVFDWFGGAVSISGDVAVIGAYGDNHSGSLSGSAYIFRHDGAEWAEEAKLTASDPDQGQYFGVDVSISGDVAFIGAWGDDDNGNNSGAVYMFDLNCPTDCPADIDGSGAVDFGDILAVLSAWGCTDCPEDLDESGVVDFADLLIVLASWGPCP